MTDTPLPAAAPPPAAASPGSHLLVVAFWLAVGLPAAWGVYRTAVNAAPLFRATSSAAPAATPAPAR